MIFVFGCCFPLFYWLAITIKQSAIELSSSAGKTPLPYLDGQLPHCGKLWSCHRLFHQLSDQEAKPTVGPLFVVRLVLSIMHLSNENHTKFDRKLHDEKPPT